MIATRTYTLTALTDIWTGDAYGKGDRLITTGLLGSIRWWFEVVVRGLGGSACDPTGDDRCPDIRKEPTQAGHRCVACELFGCTGWARKFRFDVLDGDGKPQQDRIKAGRQFQLRFTRLRPIADEEWALLDITLRLIAEYGAIGGKTIFKPSDERQRQNALHHKDFGLTKLERVDHAAPARTEQQLRHYASDPRWRGVGDDDFAWASLLNFWGVKGRYLARQNENQSTFNRVIGRPEPKANASADEGDSWLAGRRARGGDNPQPGESKKVFSFKEPESARRTFGFAESQDQLDRMAGDLQERLSEEWPGFETKSLKKGTDILQDLIAARSPVE